MQIDSSRRPLRVLHVIPSLEAGGAQMGVVELIQNLKRCTNDDVSLCVLGGGAVAPARSIRRSNAFF